MNNWKYVKHNIQNTDIQEFEKKSGFIFSESTKKIILDFNNGRPQKKQFDTENSKGKIFEKLLSFNQSDIENVFKTYDSLVNQIPKKMIALALDPFGNYICIDQEQHVFLWLHESKSTEKTNRTITDIVDNLY